MITAFIFFMPISTLVTYLAAVPSPPIGTAISSARLIPLLTAANRHAPHKTWPHGVRHAFVTVEKQIGQVCVERRLDGGGGEEAPGDGVN